MKTKVLHIIFLIFLLATSGYSVFSQPVSSSQTGNRSIILNFEPDQLQTQNVIIRKDTFIQLISPGSGTTTAIGYPALPVFQKQIISAAEAIESIDIISKTEEIQYLNHKVLPFTPQKRGTDAVIQIVTPNSQVYSTDAIYPSAFFETGTSYFYAGNPQTDIRFYPAQYNPVSGQLIIIKKAVIRINFKAPSLKSAFYNTGHSFSNKSLNSGAIKLSGINNSDSLPPRLLIVTNESLYNQAKEFAGWKMKKGIMTMILKTSDISFNPDAGQIRTRIMQIHDSFNFDHLLIIGDVSLIPGFYGLENSLNDHTYSTIEGTDFLPDIAVGRFPVSAEADCSIELEKSINYERYPVITPGNDWYRKATSVASNSFLDNSHGIQMVKFFRNEGFDSIDDLRAAIGTFRSDLMHKAFTNGRSWVFFIGHGTPNSWTVSGNYTISTLNTLNNPNMLPVLISIACQTADLDNTPDCLGRKWLSLGKNIGGVAFVGATEINEFYYSDTLGKHTVFGYFNRNALTLGAALNYGKMQMYNAFQGGAGSLTEETMQQFLLLGDPTLMPWTDIPSAIQTNLKKHRKPGQQNMNIEVSTNGKPVKNALVCLYSKDFSFYQPVYTDSLGMANFSLNPDTNIKYYITFTGYNLIPLEDSISFDTTNSIEPVKFNTDITVYPNPVIDYCSVSSHTEGKKIASVEIMDISGKVIASFKNLNTYTFIFNRSNVLSGIYLIRISDSSGLTQIKKIALN